MTALQIFAFYLLPVIVTVMALTGAWLVVRADRRRDRMHPGE